MVARAVRVVRAATVAGREAAAAAVGADGLLLEVDTDDLEALEAILGRARHASGERSWS